MPLPNILAWVVLLAVPLNIVVVVALVRGSRREPHLKVLRRDAITAAVVLLHAIVFGLIFLNNDTVPPPMSTADTKLVTRLIEVILAYAPALLFVWLYLFNGHDE